MSELPKGWCTAKFGELIELKYGSALPATSRDGGEYPVFGSNGIVGHHSSWLSEGPTIIIGRKGSVGEVCFSEKNCSPIDTSYYIENNNFFNAKFLFYSIKGMNLGQLNKSTAIPGLSRKDAYELEIKLPPLAEQTRIAQALDGLLAQVDTLKARLDALPALIKRFRQSALATAVSGKLTIDWRILNPSLSPISPNDIKKAWTETYRSLGKKYKEADLLPGELGFTLPNTWLETKIGKAFDVYVGATPSRENIDFWAGTIPWVSSSEVSFCRIKKTRELITEAGYNSASTTIHPVGTVMLAMIGQGKTRGQPAILDVEACHNQNTAAIRVHPNYCNSEYLYYYLYERYEETRRIGAGNNQQALNKKSVQSLPFPLPPLAEQTEIVRRVEQFFSFADQLEARLADARARVDALTQSILAKAFRGELVPQDPADEPASVLLERIKAQRTAAPKPKRGRKSV